MNITTIGELRTAIANFSDDDNVFIELHDGEGRERTREFHVKKIRLYESGNAEATYVDGKVEVRLCI